MNIGNSLAYAENGTVAFQPWLYVQYGQALVNNSVDIYRRKLVSAATDTNGRENGEKYEYNTCS